jgi:hypothetical protein
MKILVVYIGEKKYIYWIYGKEIYKFGKIYYYLYFINIYNNYYYIININYCKNIKPN